MFELSERSKERMEGVDSRLIAIAELAIALTPIDFGIAQDGGFRTAERQNELCKAGKSNADGYIKIGNHQTGKALDVYAYDDTNDDGKKEANWQEDNLIIIAGAMFLAAKKLGIKIKWGGLFKTFKDLPHFELA